MQPPRQNRPLRLPPSGWCYGSATASARDPATLATRPLSALPMHLPANRAMATGAEVYPVCARQSVRCITVGSFLVERAARRGRGPPGASPPHTAEPAHDHTGTADRRLRGFARGWCNVNDAMAARGAGGTGEPG